MWLIDAFSSFFGLIKSIVIFIFDAITSIMKLVVMLPEYIGYLSNMVSILPSWIIAFLGGVVVITVIWTIRKAV